RKPWTRRAERSERRCEVGTAVAEAAVISGAVAHAASVEAENRKACLGDPASELRLARKGAGADLVAAGDDQQSGVVRSVVERADERLALARECQPASFDKLRTPLGHAQGQRRVFNRVSWACRRTPNRPRDKPGQRVGLRRIVIRFGAQP